MSKINAIFCDINGVLFEQQEFLSARYARDFNYPFTKICAYFDTEFGQCLTGKADFLAQIQNHLEEWHWQGSAAELLAYWLDYTPNIHLNLIAELNKQHNQGIKIYLATQNEKYQTQKYLSIIGSLIKHEGVYATYEIGFKKSQPEYLLNCLKLANFEPEQVLFIDNNPKAIEISKSLGINSILVIDEAQAISALTENIDII